MSQDEFRVKKSSSGYRVELWRNGEPYVTFLDGLTRQGAEREARSLAVLWAKISVGHLMVAPHSGAWKMRGTPKMIAIVPQSEESQLSTYGSTVPKPELEEELYDTFLKMRDLLEQHVRSSNSDLLPEKAKQVTQHIGE